GQVAQSGRTRHPQVCGGPAASAAPRTEGSRRAARLSLNGKRGSPMFKTSKPATPETGVNGVSLRAVKPQDPTRSTATMSAFAPAYIDLKVRLHQRMLEVMNLSVIDKMPQEQIKREVGELVKELLSKETVPLNATERNQIVADIYDEFIG